MFHRSEDVTMSTKILVCCFVGLSWAAHGDSFVVDTRSEFKINDIRCEYCDGEYGGEGGRKATFLSGPQAFVHFQIDAGTAEHPAKWFLVNGVRQGVDWFTLNVGTLSAGDKVEVVAVDYSDHESKPFRINFDIANMPNEWRINQTSVRERNDHLEYQGGIEQHFVFDAVTDVLDLFGETGLVIYPTIDLQWSFNSSTGQARLGAGYGQTEAAFGCVGSSELRYGLEGGRVLQWHPQRLDYEELGSDLGVSLSAKTDLFSARIPQTLYLVYVKAGLEGSGKFALKYSDNVWQGELTFDPLFGIVGTVGAGVQGVACVEGYAKGGMVMTGRMPGTLRIFDGLGFRLYYGWKAVVLGFIHEDSGSQTYWVNGLNPEANNSLRSLRMLANLSGDDGGFNLLPRDYQTAIMKKARLLQTVGETRMKGDTICVEQNGYPCPSPSLTASGVRDSIAYLRDSGTRNLINRTELVVRDGVSNEWTSAESVWNDGTADFMPMIGNGNGKTVVAWANARKELSDTDSLETLCANLEIAVGVREANGAWRCQNLTDDSALDMAPVLKVSDDGSAAVLWMHNSHNSIVGTSDAPSKLMASFYRDGNWSSPVSITGEAGNVSSYDIAFNGRKAVAVYAKNCSQDVSEVNESEIFAVPFDGTAWGAAQRITNNSAQDMRPYAWYGTNGVAKLSWLRHDGTNNVLHVATMGVLETETRIDGSERLGIADDYKMVDKGDGCILLDWQDVSESGNIGTDLRSAVLDAEGRKVSAVLNLLDTENVERNPSGAFGGDGILRVAYESVVVSTNADGTVEYGAVDLCVFRRPRLHDLLVDASAFSFTKHPEIGRSVGVKARIVNVGSKDETNVCCRVSYDDGSGMRPINIVHVDVAAYACVEIESPWQVEDVGTNCSFLVEIDPYEELEDEDRTNNILGWTPELHDVRLSFSDVRCVNATRTKRLISARIHNDGLTPLAAGAIAEFRLGSQDGELLGTDSVGVVASGAEGEYGVGYVWDLFGRNATTAYERLYIIVKTEYGHLVASVDVMTMFDSDGDGLLDGEEIAAGTDLNDSDTDRDGVSDYDEIYKEHTDPCAAPFTVAQDQNLELKVRQPVEYQMACDGGTAPYRWKLQATEDGIWYSTNRVASTFSPKGVPLGRGIGDSYRKFILPFEFPFYGKGYREVWVSDYGTLNFDDQAVNQSYSFNVFTNRVMLAPLWNSLYTFDPGEVYVDRSVQDEITFRWEGRYSSTYVTQDGVREFAPVNFAVTLSGNGSIRFRYGDGNTLASSGIIGISAGNGVDYLYNLCPKNGVPLDYDWLFEARGLPVGLSMSDDGKIRGCLEYPCRSSAACVVYDAKGLRRTVELEISGVDDLHPLPVLGGLKPDASDVKVFCGTMTNFSVAVMHQGDSEGVYIWKLDGVVQSEAGNEFEYSPTRADLGVHSLECVFNDGYWTNDVRGGWTIHVVKEIFVDGTASGDIRDGQTWGTAFVGLEEAIESASHGDVVYVAQGVYAAPAAIWYRRIDILSIAGASETVIDGGGTNRCLYGEGMRIRGFTMQNGFSQSGAGVCYGTCENCVIRNCKAFSDGHSAYGGGAYGATLINCIVYGNGANYGGATYGGNLYNCSVAGNVSEYGGAVAGGCMVYNSIVSDNTTLDGAVGNYTTGSGAYFAKSCTTPLVIAGANIDVDPQLVCGHHGDMRLRVHSPCVDAGDMRFMRSVMDFAGQNRIQGDNIDMGVYEGTAGEGVVIDTFIDGVGSVNPSYAFLQEGESVMFTASGDHPFLRFETNGVFATSDKRIAIKAGTEDLVLTAVFSNVVFYVNSKIGDDGFDGLKQELPLRTIQKAIDLCADGDVVLVADGRYAPINSQEKRIIIRSRNGADLTCIDGLGVNQCANLGRSNVSNTVLEGFTLKNGVAQNGGGSTGGILRNCVISENVASIYGGGCYGGVLQSCIVKNNKATSYGGGVYNSDCSRCVICGNSASYGGGSYNGVLKWCNVVENSSKYSAGGCCNGTVYDSCIVSNMVVGTGYCYGGGTYNATIYNCTVAYNTILTDMYAYGAGGYSVTAYNSIFIANMARGSAIYGAGCYSGTYYSSCISGNVGWRTNDLEPISSDGYSVTLRNCVSGQYDVSSVIKPGALILAKDSPCINAGMNDYVRGSVDVGGNDRIRFGTVDIGAFESNYNGGNSAVETVESPVSVPYSWILAQNPKILAGCIFEDDNGNLQTNFEAVVMQRTGKSIGGSSSQVWQDFVAGTDPANPESKFAATIEMKDGKPVITWDPSMNGKNADGTCIKEGVRVYELKGSKNLLDWLPVGDGEEGDYNFFKVSVKLPYEAQGNK